MVTTIDDSQYLAYVLGPGEDPGDQQRLKPALGPDGEVVLDQSDGSSPVRVPVRHFFRHVGVLTDDLGPTEVAGQLVAPRMWTSWPRLTLLVTDSRLVFQAQEPESDGRYPMVGHIRYPWIRSVDFAPKRGIFSDSELRVEVGEDISGDSADTGVFLHTFTFQFDKKFHPGDLARTIAQRAARYVAQTQPVEAQDRLAELAQIGPLPDPPRGEHSSYVLPVSTTFPNGHFGLNDGGDQGAWSYTSGGLTA